jgi:hypothetical protein
MTGDLNPEPWQWFGGALVIDSRYMADIVAGAIEDGLAVD